VATDLVIIFVAWKKLSRLSSYLLLGLTEAGCPSGEAALKYLLWVPRSRRFPYGASLLYGLTVAPPAWRLSGLARRPAPPPSRGPRPGVCSGHGGVQDRRCWPFTQWTPDVYEGLADAGVRVSFGGSKNQQALPWPYVLLGRLVRQALIARGKVLFTVLSILKACPGQCGGAGSDFEKRNAGLQLDRPAGFRDGSGWVCGNRGKGPSPAHGAVIWPPICSLNLGAFACSHFPVLVCARAVIASPTLCWSVIRKDPLITFGGLKPLLLLAWWPIPADAGFSSARSTSSSPAGALINQ